MFSLIRDKDLNNKTSNTMFLEVAGLFRDYIVKIFNEWIETTGITIDLLNEGLPRDLLKYINSLGNIEKTIKNGNRLYVYIRGGDGDRITVVVEPIK